MAQGHMACGWQGEMEGDRDQVYLVDTVRV